MSENKEMLKEPIRKYLETQVQRDDALKSKYNPEFLEGCVDYINNQARETLKSRSGFVEDAVVYKWARDYFVEGIADKDAEKKETEKKIDGSSADPKEASPSVPKEEVEVKTAVVAKKAEKMQPEQRSLFDFGDEDA